MKIVSSLNILGLIFEDSTIQIINNIIGNVLLMTKLMVEFDKCIWCHRYGYKVNK